MVTLKHLLLILAKSQKGASIVDYVVTASRTKACEALVVFVAEFRINLEKPVFLLDRVRKVLGCMKP